MTQLLTSSVPLIIQEPTLVWISITPTFNFCICIWDLIRALMGGPAQISDSAVVTVFQGSPLPSLYTCRAKGSVVMFGGVDKSYCQGALNWISLIKVGDWSVHMDR